MNYFIGLVIGCIIGQLIVSYVKKHLSFKTFKDLEFEPKSKGLVGGVQALMFFDNGYGASVVKSFFSYGGQQGLYELAVIKGDKEYWQICYDTPITDDVMGYLKKRDVSKYMRKIQCLSKLTDSEHCS